MGNQLRLLLLAALFLSTNKWSLAQSTSDPKFLFKTWLFLEQNNTKSRDATKFPVKDSSLFDLFQREIEIKFDTLKMEGFSRDYVFLSISFSDGTHHVPDNSIIYKKTPFLEYLSIPSDNCGAYILCINKSNGTSFRMKGFKGNDFFGLLREIQTQFIEDKNKTLSIRKFLKSYSVVGLDFECIYEGLTSGITDKDKFPCLINCSDTVVTIH
jgi:hypothetical protein